MLREISKNNWMRYQLAEQLIHVHGGFEGNNFKNKVKYIVNRIGSLNS